MNALISAAASAGPQRPASVFAGIDVCREAGLTLPEGARRPVFEDEEWDFTDVIGLPVQMPLASRRAAAQVVIDLLNYLELFFSNRPGQGELYSVALPDAPPSGPRRRRGGG